MWAPLHPHGVLLHKVHEHAAAWSLSRDHDESRQHLPNPCDNTYGVDSDAVEDSKTHCNYSSSTSDSSSTIFHPPGCLVLWLRRGHYSRLFGRKVEKKSSGEMYRNLESIAMTADNTLTTATTFPSFLVDHYTVHFSEGSKGLLCRASLILWFFISLVT